MLRGWVKSALVDEVRRRAGIASGGAISTALLSTGVSLMLVRGRRPVGLALIAAGGLLRWAETERRAGISPSPGGSARDASPATAPR